MRFDLSDEEWAVIATLLPNGGGPRIRDSNDSVVEGNVISSVSETAESNGIRV